MQLLDLCSKVFFFKFFYSNSLSNSTIVYGGLKIWLSSCLVCGGGGVSGTPGPKKCASATLDGGVFVIASFGH